MPPFLLFLLGIIKLQSQSNLESDICSQQNDFSLRRCFKHLGCFSCGPPFYDPKYRPLSVLPRKDSITKFLLFTPKNPKNAYNFTFNKHLEHKICRTPFKKHKRTVVIVPGYEPVLRPTSAYVVLKNEILKAGPYNIIIVDWGPVTSGATYWQAVADGRKVAAEAAYVLKLLKKHKRLNLKHVHIIGLSLGAHVAGWIGKILRKVGRITGLDPAGPYFQNAPPIVRLYKTDALFVDVIHTNDGHKIQQGLGTNGVIGHQDYYPNGAHFQPGCLNDIGTKLLNHLGINSSLCDHILSRSYFIASVNKCRFISVQCKNYTLFEKGTCTHKHSKFSKMGFWAKKIRGLKGSPTFYLDTPSKAPYCFSHDTYE